MACGSLLLVLAAVVLAVIYWPAPPLRWDYTRRPGLAERAVFWLRHIGVK